MPRRAALVGLLLQLPVLQLDFSEALGLTFDLRRGRRGGVLRSPRLGMSSMPGMDPDDVRDPDEDIDGNPGKGGLGRFFRSGRVVDFRSDTVTKPTFAMRRAMFRAEVGDDVWGDDPTVIKLEKQTAELFGKEAAVFTPSGTMANLMAVLAWCERGDEFICGDKSHMFLYEQASFAQFGGCSPRTVPNDADGTMPLSGVRAAIRAHDPMNHFPVTKLICVENTHNMCGGRVLPISYLRELRQLADAAEPKPLIHMDGARVMNAAAALNADIKAIVAPVDSVSLCLSKGLGAPAGSLLVGPKAFVDKARRIRKALGGGMRQAGVLAAPGIIALTRGAKRLHEDHELAQMLAEGAAGGPTLTLIQP